MNLSWCQASPWLTTMLTEPFWLANGLIFDAIVYLNVHFWCLSSEGSFLRFWTPDFPHGHLAYQSTQAREILNCSLRASTLTTTSLFQRENPLAKIKRKTYLVDQRGRKWLWRRDWEYPCKPQGMQVRVPCYSSSQKLPIISRKKIWINFTLGFLTGFLLWWVNSYYMLLAHWAMVTSQWVKKKCFPRIWVWSLKPGLKKLGLVVCTCHPGLWRQTRVYP